MIDVMIKRTKKIGSDHERIFFELNVEIFQREKNESSLTTFLSLSISSEFLGQYRRVVSTPPFWRHRCESSAPKKRRRNDVWRRPFCFLFTCPSHRLLFYFSSPYSNSRLQTSRTFVTAVAHQKDARKAPFAWIWISKNVGQVNLHL